MATPTLSIRDGAGAGTLVSTAESTTGWSSPSQLGNLMLAAGTDAVRVGSAAIEIEFKAPTGIKGARFDMGAGVDFTGDRRLYMWLWVASGNVVTDFNNGGVRVYAEDSSGNYGFWYVGGSDTLWVGSGYKRIVVNLNQTPDATGGTAPDISDIQYVGAASNISAALGKAAGMYIDQVHYGTHVEITGGTDGDPVTAQNIHDADTAGLGMWVKNKSDIYELGGKIVLGDESGSTNSVFSFQNNIFIWADNPLAEGDNELRVDEDTGTTKLLIGSSSGTGDDEVGFDGIVMFSGGRGGFSGQFDLGYELDFTVAIDTLKVFGSVFFGADGGIRLAADSSHLWKNNRAVDCGQVIPSSAGVQRSFFNRTNDVKQALPDAFISEDGGVFTDQTAKARDATANDMTLLPTPAASTDRGYVGGHHAFSIMLFIVGTAGAGTYTISWEYSTGQNTWSSFTPNIDTANNWKTAGAVFVSLPATIPSDWVPVFVNNQGPFYMVRYTRDGGTQTTQPLGSQMVMFPAADSDEGSALAWPSTSNIKNVDFIANTSSEVGTNPSAIAIGSAGTVTFPNLRFANNDFDIRFSGNATILDSYAFSNSGASAYNVGGGVTFRGAAQSFASGAGGVLSRVRWFLNKVLAPTGNVIAKLYAHSGTFGTSSVPTGTALALSEPVDISTIPATSANRVPVDFEFKDQVSLTASTNYVISVEYSGGDTINYLQVGRDISAPTHAGNAATLIGTWTAAGSFDLSFQLNVGGILVVSNTEFTDINLNAQTYEIFADIKGAVVFQNNISVLVTALDAVTKAAVQGARVLVEAAAGGDLPSDVTVTITRSGTIATVAHTAHGLKEGKKVVIRFADQPEYNGIRTIFNVATNSYSYTVSGSPTTPATGTIKATAVILDGDTDSSGEIEDPNFDFTADQPVSGRVRKGTAAKFYKTGDIVGTITDQGVSLTSFLLTDQ